MIAFDLVCSKGHKFECWFKDSASFEKQKSAGIINCPVCNDCDVEKAFSPFAIKKNGGKKEEGKEQKKEEEKQDKVEVDPRQVLRLVQEYVEKNFEDVGVNFTAEALKIHYGESKKRNIKGTATPDQENLLKQEGIQFFKIPIVKRLDN